MRRIASFDVVYMYILDMQNVNDGRSRAWVELRSSAERPSETEVIPSDLVLVAIHSDLIGVSPAAPPMPQLPQSRWHRSFGPKEQPGSRAQEPTSALLSAVSVFRIRSGHGMWAGMWVAMLWLYDPLQFPPRGRN